MTVQPMTPAGWVTGPDLIYRVADALHAVAAAAGRPPIAPLDAATAAEAVLGMALSQPRPPLGAFVRQGGEWFSVPPRLWAAVIDAEGDGALSLALLSPTLPAAFGPYAGQVALYGAENATDFVSRLAQAVPPAAPSPQYRDPERPWRDFRSVSAWLSSRQSTRFIDEKLAEGGNNSPRPIDRDRALFAHLEASGESFGFAALQSRRRPSRMTE